MSNEIEKTKSPNPEDVLIALTSFNDPSVLTGIFKELGWNYTFEIKEWLAMARQNANLAVKAKALIQLRKLLHEAAETAGYTANVSQTIPNAQGGQTTFSAKRMSGMLNPIKQIESTIIKEPENDRKPEHQTESDRGCNRKESQRPNDNSPSKGTDTLDQFPLEEGDGRANSEGVVTPGGLESRDGGEAPGRQRSDTSNESSNVGGRTASTADETKGNSGKDNPCIETRPPTCNQDLYPGISTPAEDE